MKRFLPVLFFAAACAATSWAGTESDAPGDTSELIQTQAEVETQSATTAKQGARRRRPKQSIEAALRDRIAKAIVSVSESADTGKVIISTEGLGETLGTKESIVAILAVLLIFGTPIMLVTAVLYARHRKRRLALDMARDFLSSGQQVPPEVWQGLAGDTSPRSNLHKGMIMLGVGAGVFLCFWLMGSMEAAYLALIPLFIGVAQLLIWILERQKANPRE